MEPENLNIEEQETESSNEEGNSLQKVTPLSKYLAMALFIVMPFIGGWIGYEYAPEKVVEIERVVMKESVSEAYTSVPGDVPAKSQSLFENPDSVFVLDDLNTEIEVALLQDAVGWRDWNPKSDRWNEWNSFVVSNPDELRYLGLGLFTDNIDVYRLDTIEAISIPDSIQLDPSLAITMFSEQGQTFVENGERLFISVPIIMTGSRLVELLGFERANLAVLGYGYITDGASVYSLNSTEQGDQIRPLDGVAPDNFEFYSVNNSDHPSNVFVISENRVYFQDLLLEGIDFENAEFLRGNTIVKDTDTVWFASGGCHYKTYRFGSLEEIDEYIPPC